MIGNAKGVPTIRVIVKSREPPYFCSRNRTCRKLATRNKSVRSEIVFHFCYVAAPFCKRAFCKRAFASVPDTFFSKNRSDEAIDDSSLEQQLLYGVTNPVKDGLVDRVAHWKGFSSYEQLATGKVESFTYLDRTAWHRAGGDSSRKSREAFTKTVTVELSPIPAWEHMPAHKRRALFRRRVREIEQSCRAEREREGRREMGPTKLAKVDHRDRPKTKKPRTRQPLCQASSVEAANEYKSAFRSFLDRFWHASGMWLKGVRDVEFPAGSFRPPLLQLC